MATTPADDVQRAREAPEEAPCTPERAQPRPSRPLYRIVSLYRLQEDIPLLARGSQTYGPSQIVSKKILSGRKEH